MYSARKKIQIDLNLSLDYAVSKQTCCTVLEAMLKYILYQRQQVPIQLDILSKEMKISDPVLNNNSNIEMSSGQGSEVDIKTQIRNMALLRRETHKKQSYHRRRKQWKTKVIKFLDKFTLIVKTIKDEMQNCRLKEIMFLLGGSPYSAKEVYRIHLPEYFEPDRLTEQASLNRKTFHHMLRTFSASEELANLVNKKLCVSNLWVMILKDSSTSMQDHNNADLLPKLEYSIPIRATEVNIRILGCKPSVNMELTPIARITKDLPQNVKDNRGITECTKTNMELTPTVQGTLYYISKTPCKKLFSCNKSESDVVYNTYPDVGVVPLSDCKHVDPEWLKRLSVEDTPVPKRKKYSSVMSRICDSPMEETPVVNIHLDTPSPIRNLYKRIENMTVEQELPTDLWFQLQHSLNGIKQFFSINPS